MLGGVTVIITGPVFQEDYDILCIFSQIETEGVDVAATGDLTIGNITKETGKELQTITQLLQPSTITLLYHAISILIYVA